MRLGKLIYMPEESTPTIATPGKREAVAYLELSEHTHYYGRLFASAEEVLDKLLDIKRLAESGDDNGYEPYTLLEMIAQEARAALALSGGAGVAGMEPSMSNRRIITVQVKGGLIQDVTGLPPGCDLSVEDYDVQNPGDDSWDAEKECVVTIYEGGLP
jgi:hypothetical protein